MSRFEDDIRYPLAALKTSQELKNHPLSDDLIEDLLHELRLSKDSFREFLDQYREDLRANCKNKGYA